MTDQTDRLIRAPWTSEQVAALNNFQQYGGMHPFTCGNDQHDVSVVLMAHRDGWHCSDPACGYRQDWAHAFMVDRGRAASSAGPAPATARAAAVASCPGYETSPNPCRCPCYGCKHHCAAHNPDDTDLTEADVDRMMLAGVPVQIVTAPPATYAPPELPANRAVLPAPTDQTAEELATARSTNQRLNYEKQRLEKELATYRRAVAQWEVSKRGTYIPHFSLRAIGLASGKDILGSVRHLKHFERVEQAEAVVERVRRLHDALDAETDLTSPDDVITRGAAARKIAAALDGWTDPAELRRMAGEAQQDEAKS